MPNYEIHPLSLSPENIAKLADLLITTVANGGSVSFMHPLSQNHAQQFWQTCLQAAAIGKRVVLGAWAGQTLAGTVSLQMDTPPNQPHRAEIAKLMVAPAFQRQGLARQLMLSAEHHARAHHRSLLILDTESEGGASGLYEKLGYHFAGELPYYALKPYGGLVGTRLYWKQIAPFPPGFA